jgi:hypothetical protein
MEAQIGVGRAPVGVDVKVMHPQAAISRKILQIVRFKRKAGKVLEPDVLRTQGVEG